jgi:prepilin-type N-terminal cleavage/methylation domain-containing protein
MYKIKNKNGFTLIELLIVIAVIVILSALVLASLSMARTKANNSRIKADMDQLRKRAEAIYVETGMTTYCDGGASKPCFQTTDTSVGALIADIQARYKLPTGVLPANGYTIVKNTSKYCYATYTADSKTICYDSAGKQTGTSYGTGKGTGLCDATAFSCL